MYFVISKKDSQFFCQVFPDTHSWDTMVSEIKGEVIELFQNAKLEKRHFEEYFEANYRRKK